MSDKYRENEIRYLYLRMFGSPQAFTDEDGHLWTNMDLMDIVDGVDGVDEIDIMDNHSRGRLCYILIPSSGFPPSVGTGRRHAFIATRQSSLFTSFQSEDWAGVDSNHRKLSLMDLQSIPFSRSGTYPDKVK